MKKYKKKETYKEYRESVLWLTRDHSKQPTEYEIKQLWKSYKKIHSL